jgi:hypothetical protein
MRWLRMPREAQSDPRPLWLVGLPMAVAGAIAGCLHFASDREIFAE